MSKKSFAFAAAAAAIIATSANAQTQGSARYTRALAAGYLASFTCSGTFNANRTEAQLKRDEFYKAIPEYQALFPELKAEIDRKDRVVSVKFDDAMPPRMAAWRPHLGCSQLPVGTSRDAVKLLPKLKATPPKISRDDPWPMGDRNATGNPTGDRAALEKAVEAAFSPVPNVATVGVVVVQNGKIVAERYREDFGIYVPARTWSAAKSVASTIVGVAVQQKKLDVMAPAPIPEWKTPGDPRAKITTDQLLRMSSGLWTLNNHSEPVYFGGYGVAEQSGSAPLEAQPGTRFRYSNTDTMLATRGVQAVLGDGDRSISFPFTELYWKLGMMNTFPETDWRGHYVSSSQIWTTARDLARFGMLYLNDGMWQGKRILPVGWRDYVSRKGPVQPGPKAGGYGAAFWTFNDSYGLPADTFYANGGRGNYAVIVPSRNIVIVRRGLDDPIGFDIGGFVKSVLDSLE